jgi:excisionase family DNA binding protein
MVDSGSTGILAYSVEEAAVKLSISKATLYRWAKDPSSGIVIKRFKGRALVTAECLKKFVDKLPSK